MNGANVRSLLVEIQGARVLLPSAIIAEVMNYHQPDTLTNDAPAWLPGKLSWRGQTVPVIELANVFATYDDQIEYTRMLILYGIYHPDTIPFYALPIKDMPHAINVIPTMLTNPQPGSLPGMAASVEIQEYTAWLLDFAYLEKLFQDVV